MCDKDLSELSGELSGAQGAVKGVRQKEFDQLFFVFGTLSVTFSDASVTFFVTFFAKLLLPDSFCGRVRCNSPQSPLFKAHCFAG